MFRCLIFVDFVAVTAVVVVVGYGKETASTPTKATKTVVQVRFCQYSTICTYQDSSDRSCRWDQFEIRSVRSRGRLPLLHRLSPGYIFCIKKCINTPRSSCQVRMLKLNSWSLQACKSWKLPSAWRTRIKSSSIISNYLCTYYLYAAAQDNEEMDHDSHKTQDNGNFYW